MATLNTVMVMSCLALLFSLRMVRNLFRLLEVILYYMVVDIALAMGQSATLDNFKLVQISGHIGKFLFYKMSQQIVIPVATVWLLYVILHPKIPIILKACSIGIWFFGLSRSYVALRNLGVIQFTGWNMKYSLIVGLFVLVVSICFCLWFRLLLRKRDEHDSLPT